MDLIHQFLARKNNGEEFEEADKFMDAMFNVIKESLKENSFSLIEGSRLLWQLLIYSKSTGSKKQIEMMYFSILRNSRTYDAVQEEFLLLGEALIFLIQASCEYGSEAVKGCKIELPFPGSETSLDRCSKPFTLHLNSSKDVQELQALWCFAFHRVADLFVLTPHHDLILCREASRFGVVIADMCSMVGTSEASTQSILTVCHALQSYATAFGDSLTTFMVKKILTGLTEWLSFAVTKMCAHPEDNTPLSGAVEASLEEVVGSIVQCTYLIMVHSRVVVMPVVVSVSKQVMQLLRQLTSANADLLLKTGLKAVCGTSIVAKSSSHKPPLAPHSSSSSSSSSSAGDEPKSSAASIAVMFTKQLLHLLSVPLISHGTTSTDTIVASNMFPGVSVLLSSCVDLTSSHWACLMIGHQCKLLDAAAIEFIFNISSGDSDSSGMLNMMGYNDDDGTRMAGERSAKHARFSEHHQSRGLERQDTAEGEMRRKRVVDCECTLSGGVGKLVQEFADLLYHPLPESSADVVSAFKNAMEVMVPFEMVLHCIITKVSRNNRVGQRGLTNLAVSRFIEFFSDPIKDTRVSDARNVLSWLVLQCFVRLTNLSDSHHVSTDTLWSGSVFPTGLRSLLIAAVRNVRESAVASLKTLDGATDTLLGAMQSWNEAPSSVSASSSRVMSAESLFAVYVQSVAAWSTPLSPGTNAKKSDKSGSSSKESSKASAADTDSLFLDLMECDDVSEVTTTTPKKGKTNRAKETMEVEDTLLALSEAPLLPAKLAPLVLILSASRLLQVFKESKIFKVAAARAGGGDSVVTLTKAEFTSAFELFSKPLSALLTQLQACAADVLESGASLKAVFETIEEIFGCFSFVISQSFLQEIKSITPIAKHSTVLTETLLASSLVADPEAVLQNPELCLSRIHLFLTVSNWKESVNQTSYRNNADTNDSALVMTEPLSVSAVPGLVGKLAGSLVDTVIGTVAALMPQLKRYAAMAVAAAAAAAAASSSDRISDPEDSQMDDTQGSFFADCDQFGMQKSLSATSATTGGVAMDSSSTPALTAKDHLMFVELLLQVKTLLSALILCRGADVSSTRDPLLRRMLELDSVWLQLLPLNILGHSARMRMSQLMTVALVEQAHIASCHQVNSYYSALASAEQLLDSSSSLDQFRRSDTVMKIVALLSNAYESRKPGFLMAVSGLMRFARLSLFTQPHMALFVLGEVLRAWMSIDMDDKHSQNIVNEELSILAEKGLLSHLLIAHDVKAIDSILLPVFYSDVVSNVLADYALEIIINHVDSFREEASADHFLSFVSRRLVTTLVTAPSDSGEVTAAEIIGTLSRRAHGLPAQFPHASRTLVEGRPTLIYNFLVSPFVVNLVKTDVRSLLLGTFRMLLEHTAAALNIELSANRRGDDPLMPETQLRRVLMPLIWDLGAEDPTVSQAAMTVLPVFAFMLDRKGWKLSDALIPKGAAALQAEMNECLASLVSDQMLYAMANLLQNDQHTSHQNHQVRCLQCLKALVTIFRQSDNAKFLPKILVEMGIALSSPNGKVRLAAVQLCGELCNRLHKDVLCSNLSSLVVILFPILETTAPSVVSGADDLIVHDLKCHGKLSMNMQFVAKLSLTGVNAQGFSDDMQMMCTAAHWNQLNQDWSQQIRQTAIGIIKNLFLTRRSDIQKALQSVAYIPNVEELKTICSLHVQELRALTLEQSLKLLCQMMTHDSSQVRLLALKRLHVVCREQKHQLYQILSASASALELKAVNNHENIVGFLMQELLQLTAREADSAVQEAIARCLGELGAIEPGRLQVKLCSTGGNTNGRSSGVSVGQSQTFQPWFMNPTQVDDFAFYLLENHLVPGLRSAALADSQDKSGYAIQTILLHLGRNASRTVGAAMPEALSAALASRNILEVTEAFWNTQYKMINKNEIRCPPIYFQGLSFPRWISLWTRFLIKQSRGRLKPLFDGCRGVVRSRSELCQFLLPHLIVDILTHYDHNDDTVTVGIIQEIATVLRGTREDSTLLLKESNLNKKFQSVDPKKSAAASVGGVSSAGEHQLQYHQMCVQSVFVLLDTLTLWQSTGTQNLKDIAKTASSVSSNGDTDAYRVDVILSAIGSLFGQLPRELLCSAAQHIKAYARALRYIESHARDLHRNYRLQMQATDRGSIQSGVSSNAEGNRIVKTYRDGTNGELPVLSAAHLNTLVTIYAKLDDSDSLQGTQVLRQIQGYKCTPWERIAELEHTDDWLGTQLEYGLIHNSAKFSRSLDRLCGAEIAAPVLSSARKPAVTSNVTSALTLTLNPANAGADQVVQADSSSSVNDESEGCMELREIEDLEKGRLRCLMELGHLEAVIDQTLGMVERLPTLESALTPLGVEAAWRLARWDDLDSFLKKTGAKAGSKDATIAVRSILSDAENFQVSIGKLMQSMKQKAEGKEIVESAFAADLRAARIHTMSSLSAASMESYNRAFPMLTRLHVLHELESGYDVLLRKPSNGAEDSTLQRMRQITELCWDQRLTLATSGSSSQRSMLFAVRRSVLGLCGMPSLIAQNWLELSTILRQSGKFDSARTAIRYAESNGLDPQQVLLQECHILRGMGQGNKALALIEPVEIDAAAIIRICKSRGKKSSSSNAGYPPELDTIEKRLRLAERLHLATQLMVENQQKQGRGIIERYNAVILLNKKWESAYFELAKYYDFLHQEAKNKEQQSSTTGSGNSGKGLGVSSDEMAQLSYTYLENALSMYGSCLKVGTKMAMQILPRMLTLWLSFTSLQEENLLVRTSSLSKKESQNAVAALKTSQARTNEILTHFATEIPPSTWFMCMPQLVSRTGHRNPDTLNIIISILQSVLCAYPKQGIWHLASMMHSFNPDRKKIARKLLQDSYKQLINSKPEDAKMLVDSQKLFANLVSLAGHACKDKKLRWTVPADIVLDRFLVPTQAVLHVCNPLAPLNRSASSHDTGDSGNSSNSYVSHSQSGDMMFIQSFNDVVDVASSKAKPKTITLTTVCGKSVKFLCKQEKDGDLRKDARMMEFNTVVNRLFKEDSAALSRNLGLRTFAVVCLNEECGILEWVNNTDCIRTLIDKAHKCTPDLYPNMSYKDIYHQFVEYQTKHEDNLDEMMKAYRALIEAFGYRPCFHRWFLDRFPDPTEWLEARTTFTRSAAVWSGVGHVIGLGDRHTENILIDQTNGECVHVDFDCLFDKGLGLARPEIVPFRLTPNMVDAMGLTGVEGCYRKTLEVCMTVLRANKDTLLSVLEPFLRDPTVMWSRSGRAQKGEGDAAAAAAAASRQNTNFHDHENKEATAMLLKIGERLNGVYNIQHPHRERFLKGALKRSKTASSSSSSSSSGDVSDLHYQVSASGRGVGLDSREESLLPLSVVGQVQRLIDEAVAEENLVQLYIGWQPWV